MYGLWLPDETVRSVLQEHDPELQALPFVLITSIDSDNRPGLMPWAGRMTLRDPSWAVSTVPLVVPGIRIAELLDDPTLFTGFDEMWILPAPVGAEPPSDAFLVAPQRLSLALPPPIEQWAKASNALLGLGDGYGLNVVVADSALAHSLGLS